MKYVNICVSRKKFLDSTAQIISRCLIGSKAVAEGQKIHAFYLEPPKENSMSTKLFVALIEGTIRYFKTDQRSDNHATHTEISTIELSNAYFRQGGTRQMIDTAIEKLFLFSNIKTTPQKIAQKHKFKL